MSVTKKVFVTGASGFVGQNLVQALVKQGNDVIGIGRTKQNSFLHTGFRYIQVQGLTENIAWQELLAGAETVIHAAARVHVMQDSSQDPLSAFRQVNTIATLTLAKQAVKAGVKRFVFISSIKVNGEDTKKGRPFKESDSSIPSDPYGLSKYEAEQGLLQLAEKTDLEVVIIRPPLVYGPGVKANFASLIQWSKKSIPLPLGAVQNMRSFIAIENLVDFIMLCTDRSRSPKAANEVYLISDDGDVSTTQLLRKMASAYKTKTYLLPVPVKMMTLLAQLIGQKNRADKLFGYLQIDCTKAKQQLAWKPITTMDEQLAKMAKLERMEDEKNI